MEIIFILSGFALALATFMTILFFVNDKEKNDEIKYLKSKLFYYLKVLNERAKDDERKGFDD